MDATWGCIIVQVVRPNNLHTVDAEMYVNIVLGILNQVYLWVLSGCWVFFMYIEIDIQ